jgi:hypothetical protein
MQFTDCLTRICGDIVCEYRLVSILSYLRREQWSPVALLRCRRNGPSLLGACTLSSLALPQYHCALMMLWLDLGHARMRTSASRYWSIRSATLDTELDSCGHMENRKAEVDSVQFLQNVCNVPQQPRIVKDFDVSCRSKTQNCITQ